MSRPPPSLLLLGLSLALLGGAAQAQTSPAPPSSAQTSAAPIDSRLYTLADAYAGLAQAPSVTRAALSVQVAAQNLAASRAALGLTVNVTGSANYAGPTSTTAADGTATAVGGTLSGSAGANVTLGLLPWSSAQSGLRTAERSLAQAQANLREAQATTRLNAAQAYWTAALAGQDITLAGRTLAQRQRQLTVVQAQQAAGNATAETLLSAQAGVQAAQASLAQAQASLDGARRSLEAVLGIPLGGVTFAGDAPVAEEAPDLAALVARARTARSEVVSAQNALASAQDALATEERDTRLPDLNASVGYGGAGLGTVAATLNLKQGTLGGSYTLPLGSSSGSTSAASSGSARLTASISGSYTIFSPAQQAQRSAAAAAVTQAELALTVAQQNAELDVRTRAATLQTNLAAVQSRQSALTLAAQSLDTARARLAAGTATADDVASAELAVAQAERDLLSARITAALSQTALLNAAGGSQ
ncbi:TolC family protein [Deinococcus sp. HMF7620]|uniref:TolC family protein n=1 Tax=Deinococcus arboris TaxID=2682977 RepID=A0A7C9LIU3_9DEIO|nr:TolC family protein [Deinococcus arboris]MVN85358.1 TolC family protein [Deinococcus arboris]